MEEKSSDVIRETLELHGISVMMHTADCELWGLEHPNCHGCPHGLGCVKMACIGLKQLAHTFYTPKDFDDYELMNKRISETVAKMIDAKTIEEVHELADMI